MQGAESLAERYSRLAQELPDRRRVDFELRALDMFLSSFFLLVSLPLAIPIGARAPRHLRTAGLLPRAAGRPRRPGLHDDEVPHAPPGAEARLGHHLGAALVERTEAEVTGMGRWLRATQLDEIPQFWNVLRGDMSLVGPAADPAALLRGARGGAARLLAAPVVRPGLTGFAQVRRGYETSMVEKLAHDLEWIADRSLRLYLRTLGRNRLAVLTPVATRLAASPRGRGRA